MAKINLVGARANAGYTIADAGKLANVDAQRLSRAEKSEDPKLSIGELKRLCELYKVNIDDLDY